MSEILSLNSNNAPAISSREVGEIGEELAARFLLKKGYRPIVANFKVPIGRNIRGVAVTGEIDLIAFDENVLCFIEVKTRSSDEFASPLAAIDLRKQRQIIRAAKAYRQIFHLSGINFRYDAVSIILRKNARPEIEILKTSGLKPNFRKNRGQANSGEFFRT
ncbi:MAG: YraN family protein [Pyrinomonadaceae bacterium]